MSAHDFLPAHLVPCDPDTIYQQRPPRVVHGDFGKLTFGTPASPETRVSRANDCTHGPHIETRLVPRPQPPPIVTIRPCGPHASELYVRTGDGSQLVVVPLSWECIKKLNADLAQAIDRHKET